MTDRVEIPYDWLKRLSPAIAQLDTNPLFGNIPPFPWENFSEKLKDLFELDNLSLQPATPKWREADQLLADLGSPCLFIHGSLPPLAGTWTWAMPEKEVEQLFSLLLSREDPASTSPDPQFQRDFFQFVALEALHLLSELDDDRNLAPNLIENGKVPQTPCLCLDLSIKVNQKTLAGRFLISQEVHQALKEQYSERSVSVALSTRVAETLEIIVHLEAGKTTLSARDWSTLEQGDFLLLDHCSIDLEEDKARVMLTMNGIPLFRGRIKQGNVKIVEVAQYHEVEEPMAKNPNEESFHDENEHDELSEHDEDFHAEFDEEIESGDLEGLNDEEEGAEDGEEVEEGAEEAEQGEEGQESIAESAEGAPANAPADLLDLPLTVIVEVGRLQMPLQKLMSLQPGNILELDIHPENGVDLVVNQRLVGKGELIRIGDSLGIRVLDLGKPEKK